jgi:hypothetical protein
MIFLVLPFFVKVAFSVSRFCIIPVAESVRINLGLF